MRVHPYNLALFQVIQEDKENLVEVKKLLTFIGSAQRRKEEAVLEYKELQSQIPSLVKVPLPEESIAASIDAQDAGKNTALIWAIAKGYTDTAKELIAAETKEKRDFSLTNKEGHSALSLAISKKNVDVIQALLAAKRRGDTLSFDLTGVNGYQGRAVSVALKNKKWDVLGLLAAEDPDGLNEIESDKHSVISRAAFNNQLDVMCRLIAIVPKCNLKLINDRNNTPLREAIHGRHLAMVNILIAADSTALDIPDRWGFYPLHLALEENIRDIVAALIVAGCNLSMKNPKGNPTLNAQNDQGETALTLTARDNHLEAVKKLLAHDDCNPNLQTKYGNTALMLAAWNNHPEIARELLKSKRCNLELKNQDGNNALILAAKKNATGVALTLLMAGAKVNEINKQGETALHYAMLNRNASLVSVLLERGAVIRSRKAFFKFLNSCDRRDPCFTACLNFLCKHTESLIDQEAKTPADVAKNKKIMEAIEGQLAQLQAVNALFVDPVCQIIRTVSTRVINAGLGIDVEDKKAAEIPREIIKIMGDYDGPLEEERLSYFNDASGGRRAALAKDIHNLYKDKEEVITSRTQHVSQREFKGPGR